MVKKPLAARPDDQKNSQKQHALKVKKLTEAARPEGQKTHRSSTP